MVACGNSLEVNISSNVTIFVGQDQINLVSSIIKSTMVPTPSSDSLTDMATVLPAAPSIPYQAVLSGNKITVCLFQSPSPTEQSHSSFKMQPLIQLAIDHPLCTLTSTGNSVQYSISCYDAHINMAGSGKELSSKCVVCVCVCVCVCVVCVWCVCVSATAILCVKEHV